MSQYVESTYLKEIHDLTYDLYAVSNHSGSLNFGHYTAMCKNEISGKWYEYNDSSVHTCNMNEIVSENAYVLYYKRRDFIVGDNFDFTTLKIEPDMEY